MDLVDVEQIAQGSPWRGRGRRCSVGLQRGRFAQDLALPQISDTAQNHRADREGNERQPGHQREQRHQQRHRPERERVAGQAGAG